MEISNENLFTLSEYLKHSLSPDANIRRPGNTKFSYYNLISEKGVSRDRVDLLYFQFEIFGIGIIR